MGKRDQLNEEAMRAVSLRRRNMTVAKIAIYLNTSERRVYLLLARARQLFRLLAKASDSDTHIGETLSVLMEMERIALEKFSLVNPNSSVAVAYLNAARDARKEIKRLLQEAGLMTKVAEEVKITGVPLGNEEIRNDVYDLLKKINEISENNHET